MTGTCGERSDAQTLAPETCAAWRQRPVDWADWGLSPPGPPPAPITAREAQGATQPGLFG